MNLGPLQSLQIVLPGAVATSELRWTMFPNEITDATGAIAVLNAVPGATDGATPVLMTTAPAAGKHLAARFMVDGKDTVAQGVTIQLDDNGTVTDLFTVTLQPGDVLNYRGLCDWDVKDDSGSLKTRVTPLFVGRVGLISHYSVPVVLPYAATVDIDWSLSDKFEVEPLTGNVTITYTGAILGQMIRLKLTNDGSVRTLAALPGTTTWYNAPAFTQPGMPGANKSLMLAIEKTGIDTYDGFVVGMDGN